MNSDQILNDYLSVKKYIKKETNSFLRKSRNNNFKKLREIKFNLKEEYKYTPFKKKTPPSIKATLAEIQKKVGIIKATRRDCARSARENFGPFWPILRGERFKIGHFKAPKLTKILHFCQKKVVIIKATFGDLVKIPDFGP